MAVQRRDASDASGGLAQVRAGDHGAIAEQPPILATVVADWTSSDAWVFSSIEGTGPDDGYTVAQIIGKADRINHALLPEAEFIQAVPRLIAAGLIGAPPWSYVTRHIDSGQLAAGVRGRRLTTAVLRRISSSGTSSRASDPTSSRPCIPVSGPIASRDGAAVPPVTAAPSFLRSSPVGAVGPY